MSPLRLSDSELGHVMSAAHVLAPADREMFLRQVAAVLELQPTLGDGLVARVCREIQARFWHAPDLDTRPAKYAR